MIRPPKTTARHLGAALLIATACAIVFSARVFTGFTGVRVRAPDISTSPVDGVARVRTEGDRWRELAAPFAVIVRIHNGSPAPQRFSISVDGEPVCDADVPAGTTRRIDCAKTTGAVQQHHEVVVRPRLRSGQGSSSDWTVEYVELATHHGRSSGVLTAFVLPAGIDRSQHPSIGWTVLVWLILVAAFAAPLPRSPATSRAERFLCWALMAFVAFVFAAAYVSPMLTPYRVVLSTGTFAGWLIVVLAARVSVFLGPEGRRHAARRSIDRGRQIWAWLVARNRLIATRAAVLQAVGVALVVGWVFFSFAADLTRAWYHGNVSGLAHISQRFFDGNPLARDRPDIRSTIEFGEGNGYDGQWFYQMAYDPFLRAFRHEPRQYRSFIDAPPYRYGRIGFSLLTKAFSGNQPQWYPAVMATLIVVALSVCGGLLGAIARRHGGSVWHGALIILISGYWCSVGFAVPEPVAAAFFLGGYLCLLQHRWLAAGLLFGCSLLVRETGGAFVLALVVAMFFSRQRREAAIVGLLAFVPLAAWRLYVGWVFLPEFGLEAFTHAPDDLDPPLKGIWDLWTTIANGSYFEGSSDMTRAGIAFPLLVIAGIVLAAVVAIKRPGPVALAGLVYAALAMTFNYRSVWLDIGNAQRLTIDLFLSLALAWASLRRHEAPRLWLVLAGFWIASAVYLLFGTYNVPETQRAIFPW